MWWPGEHLGDLAPTQTYCLRKRLFLRLQTSIPFQKRKDPNLRIQLTEEPQKWSVTPVEEH